jgi:hypothetical protein
MGENEIEAAAARSVKLRAALVSARTLSLR